MLNISNRHIIAKVVIFYLNFVAHIINMMKKPYLLTISAVVLSFLPVLSDGQELPVLPDDPGISRIVLPDGITCYLAENESVKGKADFALVRRGFGADESVRQLDSLPRLRSVAPASFLRSGYIFYGRRGYAVPEGDGSVVRFDNVRLRAGEAVTDSLLLVIFDMIDGRGKPEDEAIVISGDIDRDAMHAKLRLLSLMIPASDSVSSSDSVHSCDSSSVPSSSVPSGGLCVRSGTGVSALVNIDFNAGEIPERYRGTALPAVSARMWEELKFVLEDRIRTAMESASVPVADLRMSYRGFPDGERHENYCISVMTSPEDSSLARCILDSVLFLSGKVTMAEYRQAKSAVDMAGRRRAVKTFVPDSVYVKRCAASFLYGSSLVSDSGKYSFFEKRLLPDSLALGFLNDFASGLLSGTACGRRPLSDSLPRRGLVNLADTLLFPVPSERCGVRMSRQDQSSGSRVWTFANGIKVVYKQMPTDGMMYYSYVLKDGYSSMKDMRDGEGAFLSDMLPLCSVCGLSGREFRTLLAVNGITMQTAVSLNSSRISGSMPSGRLSLLMKSLLALTKSRSLDRHAWQMYMEEERIRLQARYGCSREKMFAIDSLMNGEDRYSPFKSAENLHEDLPERAMPFFDNIFSKSDDGLFVLVGDMYESDVRKLLQQYMGGFRTIGRRSLRSAVSCQTATGESTYFVKGKTSGIDITMTCGLVLNPENFMASQVAAMALEDALADAVYGSGMYVTARNSFAVYPEERFSVFVSAAYASEEGLPADVGRDKLVMALMRMRLAASGLSDSGLDEERLALYKAMLSDRWASLQDRPEYWLSVISGRYAGRKDLQTRYQENIDAVDAETVSGILSALVGGGRLEYVTKGKNATKGK